MYRAWNKGLQILFSNSGAGPGRTAKQEQEEISCIHVQTFSGLCAMSDDGVELLMLNVFSPLKDSRGKEKRQSKTSITRVPDFGKDLRGNGHKSSKLINGIAECNCSRV